ncbi:hypothetical protein E3N88_27071 [Mikania micrantha]|uniref:Uncharacterized protein n=1 Tax=Mikania micrantha TaxID=192012 RepID=A0A5N6MWT4_9ASTR|nr:hypothetical protein E3N88_27071 [Mikania micrantha]
MMTVFIGTRCLRETAIGRVDVTVTVTSYLKCLKETAPFPLYIFVGGDLLHFQTFLLRLPLRDRLLNTGAREQGLKVVAPVMGCTALAGGNCLPLCIPRVLIELRELLSAYMRYVKAKHESIDSKLLPGYKGHVIAERLGLFPYICPIYKHTDLDITGGVNEVKVLPKEVKNRFKLNLLDMHTRMPR